MVLFSIHCIVDITEDFIHKGVDHLILLFRDGLGKQKGCLDIQLTRYLISRSQLMQKSRRVLVSCAKSTKAIRKQQPNHSDCFVGSWSIFRFAQ